MCKKHHQGSYRIVGSYATLGRGCEKPDEESDNVVYNGPNLPCSGVNTNDVLTIALQKLDAKLCELQSNLYDSSTTTTSTTLII